MSQGHSAASFLVALQLSHCNILPWYAYIMLCTAGVFPRVPTDCLVLFSEAAVLAEDSLYLLGKFIHSMETIEIKGEIVGTSLIQMLLSNLAKFDQV